MSAAGSSTMTIKIFPKAPWCTTPCHIRSNAQALMLKMKERRGSSTDQERLPIQSPKNSSGTKVISMYKIIDDTTAQAAKSVAVPAQREWSWSQKGTVAARSSSSQFSCSVYRSMVKKRARRSSPKLPVFSHESWWHPPHHCPATVAAAWFPIALLFSSHPLTLFVRRWQLRGRVLADSCSHPFQTAPKRMQPLESFAQVIHHTLAS